MPFTKNRSFFLRVFFWMCLVALTPMLIVSIQGYHCSHQAVIDRAENHLISVLDSRKSMFQGWMNERKADIRSLSVVFDMLNNIHPVSSPDTAIVMEHYSLLLEKVIQENPSFEAIMIFDENGNGILDTESEKHPDGYFMDREILERLLVRGNEVNIGISHLHSTGGIAAYAGYKTIDSTGNSSGYILTNLNLSYMFDPVLLDRAGLGESGKVYLYFPSAGKFYIPSSSDQSRIIEAQLSDNLVNSGTGIAEYIDYKGNGVLGIAALIDDIGALLVVEIDQDEAFKWVHILGIRALITAGVTLLVLIFVALSVSKYLAKPLNKLVAVTKMVAKGKHTKRLEDFSGKEFREVAQSFNQMLDKLLESHRRVVRVESLAAVGTMSSAIVHEMRSPLSSIKINAQAVRERLQSDQEYAEINQITTRQIGRLESMLSNLLSYAKPLDLKLTSVNMEQVVQDVRETVNTELKNNSCSLVFSNGPGDKPFTADAEQIRIALTNLVLNAAQASPPESEILLHAKQDDAGGGNIQISVSDSGPGVADDLRDKIFKPFFTTRKAGTGLGLANVKKIIELHGGEVEVHNAEGKGAVFTIILPMEGLKP